MLLEEFFGPRYVIFKTDTSKTIDDINKENPKEMEEIIKNIKDIIYTIADKDSIKLQIVHHLLYKFILYANQSEKLQAIELTRDSLLQIIGTRDGAKFGTLFVGYSTVKDRKLICKLFKDYVKATYESDYGHMVLLKVFLTLDDTVLVNKIILKELKDNLLDAITHKNGSLLILCLLCGINSKHYPPEWKSLLSPTLIPSTENPSILVPSSKKEPEKKEK